MHPRSGGGCDKTQQQVHRPGLKDSKGSLPVLPVMLSTHPTNACPPPCLSTGGISAHRPAAQLHPDTEPPCYVLTRFHTQVEAVFTAPLHRFLEAGPGYSHRDVEWQPGMPYRWVGWWRASLPPAFACRFGVSLVGALSSKQVDLASVDTVPRPAATLLHTAGCTTLSTNRRGGPTPSGDSQP